MRKRDRQPRPTLAALTPNSGYAAPAQLQLVQHPLPWINLLTLWPLLAQDDR